MPCNTMSRRLRDPFTPLAYINRWYRAISAELMPMNRSASSLLPSNPGVESPSSSATFVSWWNRNSCPGGNVHTELSNSLALATFAKPSATESERSPMSSRSSTLLSVFAIAGFFASPFFESLSAIPSLPA